MLNFKFIYELKSIRKSNFKDLVEKYQVLYLLKILYRKVDDLYMTSEECLYVESLKRKIERLENEVKNLTEEKGEALTIAWKYLDKYIKDKNISDEITQGLKKLFDK